MNPKKLKVLKIVNIIVFTVAVVLFDVGVYECMFSAFIYDGSGSLNKSDAVIAFAISYGVPTVILLAVFFALKRKIKKYDNQGQ